MAQSHAQQLASRLLGRDVAEFIADHRDAGMSWQGIAIKLRDATGGAEGGLTVSDETIRRWAVSSERAA